MLTDANRCWTACHGATGGGPSRDSSQAAALHALRCPGQHLLEDALTLTNRTKEEDEKGVHSVAFADSPRDELSVGKFAAKSVLSQHQSQLTALLCVVDCLPRL